MPRTKKQNEEIRRLRKEQLLRSALEVYVENGYAASDIGEIAKRAGLVRELAYYYFKDKKTLFRVLFQEMIGKADDYIRQLFNREGTVLEVLETYVETMLANTFEDRNNVLFFMRMGYDIHAVFDEGELEALRWPQLYMEQIVGLLGRGMETGEIRTMSPMLLALQMWSALEQAIRYLNEMKSTLEAEGKSRETIDSAISQHMRDAGSVCLAIVRNPHFTSP
ncbi:TetR/AcrR family transcriptional regulator [Paenibacillus humicola]|uniref:TetR/AcrR family transcriptional regulator n=1 Tax=Paenibacillus humicola TaxID=3110540 RepID=UPI00237A43F6|nr:TetR/AcrR family transcriptional regulator [Paenibacillus humicola]